MAESKSDHQRLKQLGMYSAIYGILGFLMLPVLLSLIHVGRLMLELANVIPFVVALLGPVVIATIAALFYGPGLFLAFKARRCGT